MGNWSLEPDAGARWFAVVLSLMVHGAFLAVLFLGVSWQRHPEPAPMMAEIWSTLPKPATTRDLPAPPVEPVAPQPIPQSPALVPPSVSKPSSTPPPSRPAVNKESVAQRAENEAAIALKKKKQKQAQEEKKHEQERQRDKALAEQLRQERLDALKEQHQDAQRRIEAEVQRRRAEQMAQNAHAAQASLVDRYKLAIINKIRGNTEIPEGVPGGLALDVDITILPDGDVLEPVRIVRSSGDTRYDQAVLRGILRSQPLPLPSDLALRRLFRVTHLQIHHEN